MIVEYGSCIRKYNIILPFIFCLATLAFFSCSSRNIEKAKPVSNSFCLVCHLNYQDEPFAANHLSADIGCVKCHGDSLAHAGDENAVIAPDVMYPKTKINRLCLECHDQESLTEECLEDILKNAEMQKVCTDCHNKHRLTERERKWDKNTGKLTWPDVDTVDSM